MKNLVLESMDIVIWLNYRRYFMKIYYKKFYHQIIIHVLLVLFLHISFLSNAQTEYFWGPARLPNHRLELKLEQNIIGETKYPLPALGFDLEFLNLGINCSAYAGSVAKLNFNKEVLGLFVGPDIGIAAYSRDGKKFVFSEFNIGFMIANFDRTGQINSDAYGINLGFGRRYENHGFRIFARYERNYTISRDYFMLGGALFINFRW